MFTPDNITELKENEIFVFGSNKLGNHAGGAARTAVEKFGAVMGQAEGLQGQSYAIPTLDENMNKVGLDELQALLETFAEFAKEQNSKIFYLTKIGCGIAGFTEDEIIEVLNKVELPQNVIIPEDFNVIYSYKAFDKDMKCRGLQYEVGKSYEEEEAIACSRGFHACHNPFDVLNHYPIIDNNGKFSRFAKVIQSGEIDNRENDKICSTKIKIKAEIGFSGFVKACVEWVKEKTAPTKLKGDDINSGYYAKIGSSGDYAKIGSSGYSAKIGSSGDYAKIGSSGDYAKIGSSGDSAQIGSSGYSAKIGSSGDSAKIGSSGYSAKIGSSGDYAQIQSTGEDSVIMCAGANSVVSAKKGSWITLAEWQYNEEKERYTPVCVKTEYVDGVIIKECTPYKLINGKFEEVKG